jgi:hypothetical protein
MAIEKYKYKTLTQSNRKGKYATSTENRRLMWEYIIWPLVLELNKNYFTRGISQNERQGFNRNEYSNFENVWGVGITID